MPKIKHTPYGTYQLRSGRVIPRGIYKNSRLRKRFSPVPTPLVQVKKRVKKPVVPYAGSLGICEIGQGNCNLIFKQDNTDPQCYYDVGYPLWFYDSSVPNQMRLNGNNQYLGPITQNSTNDLFAVISHWDADHVDQGYFIPAMRNFNWIAPNQPLGFFNQWLSQQLNNNNNLQIVNVPFINYPSFTVYQCNGAHLPAAAQMNNTGLAMAVRTRLPSAVNNAHYVLLTGDASWSSVPMGAKINLTGILAAHHGANTFQAAANIPPQAFGYNNQGRIAYSSGITSGGHYCYNHPNPHAVAAYRNDGWGGQGTGREQSTAQGPNIRQNVGGVPNVNNRGNIRMGANTPLNPIHNNTAFAQYPNHLD